MGRVLRTSAIATAAWFAACAAAFADITATAKPDDKALASASEPDFSGANLRWLRGTDNDCWVYSAYAANSFTWTGACKDRLIDGKGTLNLFSAGVQTAVLTGTFARGALSGAGRVEYNNGSVFEGTFKDGKLEGRGKRKLSCGETYEGMFHNGEPEGQGTYHFCHNGGYSGGVRAGRFDGHGVWTMSNGAVVEGMFTAGLPVGVVSHRDVDGTVRKGELVVPHTDPAFPILPTSYPEQALRLEIEGRVWIYFTVTADGHAKDVRLDTSSGNSDLDEAAMAAAPTWRMLPATVGGTTVEWPGTPRGDVQIRRLTLGFMRDAFPVSAACRR